MNIKVTHTGNDNVDFQVNTLASKRKAKIPVSEQDTPNIRTHPEWGSGQCGFLTWQLAWMPLTGLESPVVINRQGKDSCFVLACGEGCLSGGPWLKWVNKGKIVWLVPDLPTSFSDPVQPLQPGGKNTHIFSSRHSVNYANKFLSDPKGK